MATYIPLDNAVPMDSKLALFDLDNTLLAGDSDHAWGEFLIAEGWVDEASHRSRNDAFYKDYENGVLDIHAYVKFTLEPILGLQPAERTSLHEKFMARSVMPMMLDKARDLLAVHSKNGDRCLIVTATNSFITAPIAKYLGIDLLLATDLEEVDGKLTGNILGTPCYQEGKVAKLKEWLEEQKEKTGDTWSFADASFYSDSVNDLPLLELVGKPVVVDADEQLGAIAAERNWRSISLR